MLKKSSSLKRIRTQLEGMERMIRMLRAEVDTHISAFAPADVDTEVEVKTGFGQMFAEAEPLSAFEARSYKPFFPGVHCAFDSEVGGCGATVALKALHRHDPALGPIRISRLSVNPVFPLVEKPRWITIESEVDVAALKRSKSLKVQLITFFDIARLNDTTLPRDITLTLRLKKSDGSFTDHLDYRVPVTTMPFEHSMVVADMKTAGIDAASAETAFMILALPTAGDFTLNLDHFALLTTEA